MVDGFGPSQFVHRRIELCQNRSLAIQHPKSSGVADVSKHTLPPLTAHSDVVAKVASLQAATALLLVNS